MILFTALLRERRRSTLWWSLGIVLMSLMVAFSYRAIADEPSFNQSMDDIPESVRVLLGVDDEQLLLTSPEGYLNSQLFANFLPLLLTVFAVSLGAKAIAGDENDGRLELLLAHPVSRLRLALERLAALAALSTALTVVALAGLALAPGTGLDIALGPLSAGFASSLVLGLFHGVVALAVGAFTGRKGPAIAAATVVAIGGFLAQSLAALIPGAGWVRWISPWQWFTEKPPILHGWSALWKPGLLVLVVAAVGLAVGLGRFKGRDLNYN